MTAQQIKSIKHIGYEPDKGAHYTSSCYYFDLVDEKNNLTDLAISF